MSISFLQALIRQGPSQIAILVCIILVLLRWKTFPKAALLALIGLLLLFIHTPISAAMQIWIPDLFRNSRDSLEMSNISFVVGLVIYALEAIAFLPLIAAVVIRRNQRNPNQLNS